MPAGRVLLGQRNVAPSAAHAKHDVYYVEIAPDEPSRAFCFGQSIGGGHAEQGGEICLALNQLESWPGDWRQHLHKAGCASLQPWFERGIANGDTAATVAELLAASQAMEGAAR